MMVLVETNIRDEVYPTLITLTIANILKIVMTPKNLLTSLFMIKIKELYK